jgi:hypothetical protein
VIVVKLERNRNRLGEFNRSFSEKHNAEFYKFSDFYDLITEMMEEDDEEKE